MPNAKRTRVLSAFICFDRKSVTKMRICVKLLSKCGLSLLSSYHQAATNKMPVCCQAVMESAGMDSPDMIKINISNNVNNFWDGIFSRQSQYINHINMSYQKPPESIHQSHQSFISETTTVNTSIISISHIRPPLITHS